MVADAVDDDRAAKLHWQRGGEGINAAWARGTRLLLLHPPPPHAAASQRGRCVLTVRLLVVEGGSVLSAAETYVERGSVLSAADTYAGEVWAADLGW